MKTNTNSIFARLDGITILLFLLMVIFGWLNIYAAVFDSSHDNIFDISQRYGKQAIWIASSLVIGLIILFINARFFSIFSYIFYAFFLLLMILVFFIGKEVAGSHSWIVINDFIRIQPSEFMKFATALALSKYLSKHSDKNPNFKTKAIAFCIILFPLILTLLQHDTGSAILFLAFFLVLYREGISAKLLFFGILAILLFVLSLLVLKFYLIVSIVLIAVLLFFLSDRKRKNIFSLSLIALLAVFYIFSVDYIFEKVLEDHQKNRVEVLLGLKSDPRGVGYNVNQSMIAIGSGGFSGKGYLQGTQTKYNFVPEQSTDFIFCTIGEEWGFIGSSIVVLLFLALFYRLILMAERQNNDFSRIYGYSVLSILFVQFFINIGMTIGFIPVIGITLPFFSYGGSSLWSLSILLFVFIKLDASRMRIL
jgi:rod shape determining protein RodA